MNVAIQNYVLNTLKELPLPRDRSPNVPHAPKRAHTLDASGVQLAIDNALRYFPKKFHQTLRPEFATELEEYGHIYMYRFMPDFPVKAYPINFYPGKIPEAKCIMLMIMNNLDPEVAQYPEELVCYGGNGCVFQNWMQFRLTLRYLSQLTDKQTLVINSGHPLGLFPAPTTGPRMTISNGQMIPNYSTVENLNNMYATGNTMYGQMTAGSFCYIGPQGIVHGTTLTLMNAGRKYLGSSDLRGKTVITSGLGGMSGAQGKAGQILGCTMVIGEVHPDALQKRLDQGWIDRCVDNIEECLEFLKARKPGVIGFLGNIVDLWEAVAAREDISVDLGTDQTSLHDPFGGGYLPVGYTLESAQELMASNASAYQKEIRSTLVRHVAAVNTMASRGTKFWDYGNAFLLRAQEFGADIFDTSGKLRYPSYFQSIMGDIFAMGFGPFRWICSSGNPDDLDKTDMIAGEVIESLIGGEVKAVAVAETLEPHVKRCQQYQDNLVWIRAAKAHQLVVGSQARILYSDAIGRLQIAKAFNKAVRDNKISAPIVLSRDHHDVSGTDSPWRETSNIEDGSKLTADMAVQNVIGDAYRGASWVALHNGGGVGWGQVVNGGFGMVLDGTEQAEDRIKMLYWDVLNGVTRRAWAGQELSQRQVHEEMQRDADLVVNPFGCFE
jgi:urocanate hydratase